MDIVLHFFITHYLSAVNLETLAFFLKYYQKMKG